MKKFIRIYCYDCKKAVKSENVRKVNHILHICLGILTAGLWFIIYGCLLMGAPVWACSVCGSKNITEDVEWGIKYPNGETKRDVRLQIKKDKKYQTE